MYTSPTRFVNFRLATQGADSSQDEPRDGAERENRMQRQALVIGATGGIGGATAAALLAHGWTVRAMTRDPDSARRARARVEDIEWVRGDALSASDVQRAAVGATLVVHGANPL